MRRADLGAHHLIWVEMDCSTLRKDFRLIHSHVKKIIKSMAVVKGNAAAKKLYAWRHCWSKGKLTHKALLIRATSKKCAMGDYPTLSDLRLDFLG